MYGGQSTYIPLKVNGSRRDLDHLRQLGAVPAGAHQPDPAGQQEPENWAFHVQKFVNDHLVGPTSPLYLADLRPADRPFAYFYTAIQFDPHKQADQIRKQGGFIPGIRPGHQTERYLAKILSGSPSPAPSSWPASRSSRRS
jgi:preprotein translocase subunit SecY